MKFFVTLILLKSPSFARSLELFVKICFVFIVYLYVFLRFWGFTPLRLILVLLYYDKRWMVWSFLVLRTVIVHNYSPIPVDVLIHNLPSSLNRKIIFQRLHVLNPRSSSYKPYFKSLGERKHRGLLYVML